MTTKAMPTESDLQRKIDELRRELAARTAERDEAWAQQAAAAEVLKIISSSPRELTPVFEAILKNAIRICEAKFGHLILVDGNLFRVAAEADMPRQLAEYFGKGPFEPTPGSHLDRVRRTKRVSHTADDTAEAVQGAASRYGGARTIIAVPMLSNDALIGVIFIYRQEVRPFSEKQIGLMQGFAAQAVIAIENARLFDEVQAKTRDLSESLRYQTGSANILNVIASSPTNVQPVLKAIVESACQLCEAYDAVVVLKDGDELQLRAHHGPIPMSRQRWANDRTSASGRAIADRRPVHIHDVLSDEGLDFAVARSMSVVDGCRTLLSAPLLREGEAIGTIALRRAEVHPFSDKQIALLQTFADQAVIALGNVRLFEEVQARTRELTEALTYQTGSANILRVIASSPTDVKPVLQAIVESACELCGAYDALVRLKDGDGLAFGAHHGPLGVNLTNVPISRNSTAGLAVIERKPVHVHDLLSDDGDRFPQSRDLLHGERTILSVPLLRENESLGAIVIRRREVHPFSDKQIALLQTFADQAAIAIGNVRLFEEVQARTRELTDALTYQTGSANILRVIASSPTDVAPVLQSIVESACELCDANDAVVLLRDGDDLRFNAHHGPVAINVEKWPISRNWVAGRAFLDQMPIHVHDIFSEESSDLSEARQLSRNTGARSVDIRSILGVPLLREKESIGTILLRRTEVRPFDEKQIALLRTFADQAVIAIGNVRLFEEVQARTRDLQESLQQQTATADVLKVISRSAFDLQTVLQTLVESAARLCDADTAQITRQRDGVFFRAEAYGFPNEFIEFTRTIPVTPDRGSAMGRVLLYGTASHVPDVLADPDYTFVEARRLADYRAVLAVPMLRDGAPIGVILMTRKQPRSFTEKQIALAMTFADQAAIAIGNVRLFEEVQARTRDLSESLEQQTATSGVLEVISRSAFDLQSVFNTVAESAVRLCGADRAFIFRFDGELLRMVVAYNASPEFTEFVRQHPIRPGRQSGSARAALERRTVQIVDVRDDPEYTYGAKEVEAIRTLLGVPILKGDELFGVMMIYRLEVRPFTERQIVLIETFANQAAIAIDNVRLFEAEQRRTLELAKSLEELHAAQGRLIQTEKLASLGQLTAGIAHEIKNPLNFVNNFAALSVELTDELNAALKQASIVDRIRSEVDELTGLLKDNLSKVVQHGKRADSIVKNMLLHSREGSGEHRPTDVNALVDESLNLAYHGARAERPQFDVTLQRDFDPEAGMIEAFPQEITRVLLNLISNGFYAVTKRRAENGGAGFEPIVSAMTKGRTHHVEIRIRDNGTGIPPEVKEKMFNPFFTTKPAGEGTGLGLSMSHDIIVKQHGGTIDVDTLPGAFTEFTIVLPRTSNLSNKTRG